MTKIEELFQRLHEEFMKWDSEDEPINNIKGLISMLQVEVYRLLPL